ncbi:hypothetical protein GCM10027084_15320 [Pseudoxanthomonas sangjuensis]
MQRACGQGQDDARRQGGAVDVPAQACPYDAPVGADRLFLHVAVPLQETENAEEIRVGVPPAWRSRSMIALTFEVDMLHRS